MSVTISLTDDIAACRALRATVFIEEQGVPLEDDIDDLDEVSLHLIARDTGGPVGTARLTISGSIGKISRVCVLKSHRRSGLGAALIQETVALARQGEAASVRLSAQVRALDFYERLGFSVTGPVFDDAGIPHRDMAMPL